MRIPNCRATSPASPGCGADGSILVPAARELADQVNRSRGTPSRRRVERLVGQEGNAHLGRNGTCRPRGSQAGLAAGLPRISDCYARPKGDVLGLPQHESEPMNKPRILIVEDETAVALDIEGRLNTWVTR
jgi:hypothetical protein